MHHSAQIKVYDSDVSQIPTCAYAICAFRFGLGYAPYAYVHGLLYINSSMDVKLPKH